MGSPSSKFKKYMAHGDEYTAMQVYQSSPELRKSLDPNLSYGDHHDHNTALHYAAKHGMKHLLRMFLNEAGGNPNKRNGSNETSLHCACSLGAHKTYSAQERKGSCVALILQWRGDILDSGERERVQLDLKDCNGNTALHTAALHGLTRCAQLLISAGASVFIENVNGETACDVATSRRHHQLARILESKMVFAETADVVNEAELESCGSIIGSDLVYHGLRPEDLQEVKDQLLLDTADMLNVPLPTANSLLRDSEWSRETLLEKWINDPAQACIEAGVSVPADAPPPSPSSHYGACSSMLSLDVNHGSHGNLSNQASDDNQSHGSHLDVPWSHSFSRNSSARSSAVSIKEKEVDPTCGICLMPLSESKSLDCHHEFCLECWETYLTGKVLSGHVSSIQCPANECGMVVSYEFLHHIVPADVSSNYRDLDIKEFVEQNRSIKWCPIGNCGRGVKFTPQEEQGYSATTSHAVDCGEGHYFCWECLGEAHAPCSCTDWTKWINEIATVKPEELQDSVTGRWQEAANSLWLVTNSKPCPNCGSHIQKGDGCNHIKCVKCKFDFCWVCLESWKKHSSATGGYFRCNRYEAVHKADEKQGALISEAVLRNKQSNELNRFLHYYTRFRNHDVSRRLEEPLLKTCKQKMDLLIGTSKERDSNCVKFIEDGVKELLKARRILCGSYIYGYYLDDDGLSKTIFEFMQNEVEEATERLSEILARPYLKTPKCEIIRTTHLLRRKRQELSRAVARGMVPLESPNKQSKATDTKTCARPGCPNKLEDLEHGPYCNAECEKYDDPSKDFVLVSASRDENVDLAIALEMSRLQMLEDQMLRLNGPSGSPEVAPEVTLQDQVDPELNLAIERSLQDSVKNETVDTFLKSLDGKNLDVESGRKSTTSGWNRTAKDIRSQKEDGRFRVGDVHQLGVFIGGTDALNYSLTRSHSTGDLCRRKGRLVLRDEPRYHLDSDHSWVHVARPEELPRTCRLRPKLSEEQSSIDDTSDSQTDGSKCLEVEHGIPKSPNLYISGVGICRTSDGISPETRNRGFDTEETIFKFINLTPNLTPADSGALSSVLHVEAKTADHFHEGMFFLQK
ncbi:IBR [Nesidiocoris tenuis]|uniref:RBR-type E3 ubiquitin transferase n=1 Tax=Nesidiocoris tenuis TaxID=355587 RepID=A0ABN7BEK1_9HEMI|nr:IBR [Nesidiocoris tenuis]